MRIAYLDDNSCRRIAQYVIKLMSENRFDIEPTDEMMSTSQAAKMLGKTGEAVRMMIRRGLIPFHKNGGRYVFSKNEIIKFLKK